MADFIKPPAAGAGSADTTILSNTTIDAAGEKETGSEQIIKEENDDVDTYTLLQTKSENEDLSTDEKETMVNLKNKYPYNKIFNPADTEQTANLAQEAAAGESMPGSAARVARQTRS